MCMIFLKNYLNACRVKTIFPTYSNYLMHIVLENKVSQLDNLYFDTGCKSYGKSYVLKLE